MTQESTPRRLAPSDLSSDDGVMGQRNESEMQGGEFDNDLVLNEQPNRSGETSEETYAAPDKIYDGD